jgi:hypothetical protein
MSVKLSLSHSGKNIGWVIWKYGAEEDIWSLRGLSNVEMEKTT